MNSLDLKLIQHSASTLKAIGHPDRLRIIERLERVDALSVTDLMAVLGLEQVPLSKHLLFLKSKGVLKSEVRGNFRFYSIAQRSVLSILECIRKHQ